MPLRMSYFSGDTLFPLENRHLPNISLDFEVCLNANNGNTLNISLHLFMSVFVCLNFLLFLGLLSLKQITFGQS